MGIKPEVLQKENEQLKSENLKLQEQIKKLTEENVIVLSKKEEIYPPNYFVNMKKLKALELENIKLHRALEFGNISTFETQVEMYKAISKVHLEKLAKEYQYYFSSSEERLALQNLIEHLRNVLKELESFLLTNNGENL